MSDEQFTGDQPQDEDETTTPEQEENEGKSSISADLIRGHINTIILRTLYERDKYGYEIMTEIEQKSHGQYSLKQPTLYSALKRLETQGYIKAYWKTDDVTLGGRRKYFTLTDSGKEITEKNQAEWEYSRTVIDNLISDRSFDFSQPAPTPVDFKILKGSVSRVPIVKTADDAEQEANDAPNNPYAQITPTVLLDENNLTTSVKTSTIEVSEQYIDTPQNAQQNNRQNTDANLQNNTQQQNIQNESEIKAQEERNKAHENYLKLISKPVPQPEIKPAEDVSPSDDIETQNLIYNNKPETERDYKNLINGIFNKAIKSNDNRTQQNERRPEPQQTQQTRYEQPRQEYFYAEEKGRADGLKVNISGNRQQVKVTNATGTTYNLGLTLFKCSAIIAVILLFEFVMTLIFRDNLQVTITYPLVILAIALAQLAIFGVIAFSGFGKNSSKPTTTNYISVSIILTIICILMICVIAFLLNVNFNSTSDILAKMVVPSLTTLNIPIFTSCFYIFSK